MTLSGFINGSELPQDLNVTVGVCVIGSGAGGAVAAHTLAAAGHQVLVVEEGGHYTSQHFNMQESEAYPQLYQESAGRTTADLGVSILQGRAVGGTTVVNYTTCFRTPVETLDHWRIHHAVRGLDHQALTPHWRAVEERLHVEKVPADQMNRNNRVLYEGCEALGWQVETTHRNVKHCRQSGYCGLGCPVDAKQSMLVTYLPDAVALGAGVLSRCRVERLIHQAGEITALEGTLLDVNGIKPTGRSVRIKAQKFILSAGAIGSPAVLLRSGMDDGVVGTRTFLHPVVVSVARYQAPVLACYGAPQSCASHQFADRGDKTGFVMEAVPVHPVLMASAMPGLGRDHALGMQAFANVAVHVALTKDGFFPDETGGTVVVRPSGHPVLDYAIPPRIQEALRESQKRMAQAVFASGALEVHTCHTRAHVMRNPRDIAGVDALSFKPLDVGISTAHVMGGCRMGEDPDDAVVRCEDLRAHRFKNLHVVDGSVFPTSLGVNPQLSIYGLAHLAASRMASSWGRA